MASIECQFTGCPFKAENNSEAIALAMFNSHLLTHSQPASRAPTHSQRLPPIPRPEMKQDVDEEDWDSFIAEWKNFKRCTAIPADQLADQLFLCCEKSLSRLLIREQPNIVSEGETEILTAMKRLAVIKVATSVRRTNLLTSKQSSGETFREFYANVKAAASICNFKAKCPHECCATKSLVDYTSNVVKDVLIAGIADSEIRKDVLSWEELDAKDDKALPWSSQGQLKPFSKKMTFLHNLVRHTYIYHQYKFWSEKLNLSMFLSIFTFGQLGQLKPISVFSWPPVDQLNLVVYFVLGICL